MLQFLYVLIHVILISAGVTTLLAHWVDTCVIVVVVVIYAIIGCTQEGQAETAVEAIRCMLFPEATALRDEKRMAVVTEALGTGDIVLLQSVDKVPTDLRLLAIKPAYRSRHTDWNIHSRRNKHFNRRCAIRTG